MYEWDHYAKHICGEIERVPFGNTGFLTSFNKICPNCGKVWKSGEFETFIGRYVFNGNIFNPLTWFKRKIQIQEK